MIDELIEYWQDEHYKVLELYSLGNPNNDIMKLYRTQMKDMILFISQLTELKINRCCKHTNIKSSDGLDECLDCGLTNF